MMPANCFDHNKTIRTDVTFRCFNFNAPLDETVTMDLDCRCRVYEQLKAKFIEISAMDPFTLCEIAFSTMNHGSIINIGNGYEVYNSIMKDVSFYSSNPILILSVQVTEVPPNEKIAGLEKAIKECETKIKSDKKWRVLKDTQIAEEQLSIREVMEKQQKVISDLQLQIDELRHFRNYEFEQRNRHFKEYERRIRNSTVHEASCDQCNELIIGHRFKCATCLNYDLCSKCEAQGVHPHHAMLRIVSPQYTDLPLHLIPEYREKMGDKSIKKDSSANCDSKPNTRADAKKEMASNPYQGSGSFEYFVGLNNPIFTAPPIFKKHLPEITIAPPFGQTAPFNYSDFSMKLIPPPMYQPIVPQSNQQISDMMEEDFRKFVSCVGTTTLKEFKELELINKIRADMRAKAAKERQSTNEVGVETKVDQEVNQNEVVHNPSNPTEPSERSDPSQSPASSSLSFPSFSEIIRDMVESDRLSQQAEHDSNEEFDIIDDDDVVDGPVMPRINDFNGL